MCLRQLAQVAELAFSSDYFTWKIEFTIWVKEIIFSPLSFPSPSLSSPSSLSPPQARAPGSPVVIIGTHCDTLKPEAEKEKRKAELNRIIYHKYLVGHGPQQLREMGLPKILDVIYVGCPLNGRPEGVSELRNALYDIAFSLPANSKGES